MVIEEMTNQHNQSLIIKKGKRKNLVNSINRSEPRKFGAIACSLQLKPKKKLKLL